MKQQTKEQDKTIDITAGIITALIVLLLIINIEYLIALGILFFVCCLVWLVGVLF